MTVTAQTRTCSGATCSAPTASKCSASPPAEGGTVVAWDIDPLTPFSDHPLHWTALPSHPPEESLPPALPRRVGPLPLPRQGSPELPYAADAFHRSPETDLPSPRITVVIATRLHDDRLDYLTATHASLTRQTVPWEAVIAIGGADPARLPAPTHDRPVYPHTRPPQPVGAPCARNLALTRVRTPYELVTRSCGLSEGAPMLTSRSRTKPPQVLADLESGDRRPSPGWGRGSPFFSSGDMAGILR